MADGHFNDGYYDTEQAPPVGHSDHRRDRAPAELFIIGEQTLRQLAHKGVQFPGRDVMYPELMGQGKWSKKGGHGGP